MSVRKINVSSMENNLIDKMNSNLKKQTSTDKGYADACTNNVMEEGLKTIEKVSKVINEIKKNNKPLDFNIKDIKPSDFTVKKIMDDATIVELKQPDFRTAAYDSLLKSRSTEDPNVMELEKETLYEWVSNPKHYNNYDVEVINMIEKIWGTYLAAIWCQITAFKYRMRMGTKPDNDFSQDLKKEVWYLNKYHELTEKLNK